MKRLLVGLLGAVMLFGALYGLYSIGSSAYQQITGQSGQSGLPVVQLLLYVLAFNVGFAFLYVVLAESVSIKRFFIGLLGVGTMIGAFCASLFVATGTTTGGGINLSSPYYALFQQLGEMVGWSNLQSTIVKIYGLCALGFIVGIALLFTALRGPNGKDLDAQRGQSPLTNG